MGNHGESGLLSVCKVGLAAGGEGLGSVDVVETLEVGSNPVVVLAVDLPPKPKL